MVYQNRSLKKNAIKIAAVVPEEKNTIGLDLAHLTNYVGVYGFEPFKVTISLEELVLYIQPQGSTKLPLALRAASAFLVKEIEAEVRFKRFSNGLLEAQLLIEGDTFKEIRDE